MTGSADEKYRAQDAKFGFQEFQVLGGGSRLVTDQKKSRGGVTNSDPAARSGPCCTIRRPINSSSQQMTPVSGLKMRMVNACIFLSSDIDSNAIYNLCYSVGKGTDIKLK